jgi:hypothetical protein
MIEERKAAVESTVDFVVGRVVEIGDIEALGNKPGIVIETTMEQLRAHGRNLAFCEVEIRLKVNSERLRSPASGDKQDALVGGS